VGGAVGVAGLTIVGPTRGALISAAGGAAGSSVAVATAGVAAGAYMSIWAGAACRSVAFDVAAPLALRFCRFGVAMLSLLVVIWAVARSKGERLSK
jgi:hypothetical protein